MNHLSLDPIFLPAGDTSAVKPDMLRGDINSTELRHTIDGLPFNAVYDFLRTAAYTLVTEGRTDEAIALIRDFDTVVTRMNGEETGPLLNIHAALMQILTALYIHDGNMADAMLTAASVLNLLAQSPKRKDEPFLSVLAALLYDISFIHASRDENKQAEREIEKSMKLFERLARQNPDRYGAAHLLALNASTTVYKSRVKQANTLAHYQAATSTYLQMLNEGTVEGKIFRGLAQLEQIRKREKVFVSCADTWTIETWDPSVLCIGRYFEGEKLIGLFNFSEHDKTAWVHETDGDYRDLVSGNIMKPIGINIPAFGFYYLKKNQPEK